MQVKSEEPLDVFQVDSKSNSLVLNGIPGQIQFFDYKHGLSLSEFEIAIQNHISGMNEEKPIFFKVKLVKFSKDWMLTVERRVEFENKLKFWRFDQISQSYQLNTVINNPHEREINDVDLIQTNNESMAVSCGTDKNFKLWKLEGSQWKSVKTVNYHNFETSSVSFSSDGSVFAVAFDRFVTLWSSVGDNVHVFTSDSSRIINGLQFLNDSPLLVSYSYDRLIVWNLLTLAGILPFQF